MQIVGRPWLVVTLMCLFAASIAASMAIPSLALVFYVLGLALVIGALGLIISSQPEERRVRMAVMIVCVVLGAALLSFLIGWMSTQYPAL